MDEGRTDQIVEKEVYVSVGPQHSGAGHFRMVLKLDGDIIVDVIPDPGFVHRSVEKIAETMMYVHIVPLVEKVTHVDASNLAMGYVRVVEELSGMKVPERAKYLRTIACELSRITSHLYFFGIFGIFLNHSTMFMWAFGDRDLFLDLLQLLTGTRIAHSYILAGGVRWDMPQDFPDKAKKVLDYFEQRLEDYYTIFMENPILVERTEGVGVLTRDDAIRLGAVGPVLRASGVKYDTRRMDPYAAYEYLDFEIPSYTAGDAYSRVMVRFRELQESVKIIRQALKEMPSGPTGPKRWMPRWMVKKGEHYARVEAARGELGYYLIVDSPAKPYRLKMSSPSFRNLVVLKHILKGATLADMPAIYMSLDYWAPEADR